MTKIFVRTPSRIAMSLLDMNGDLGRVDGGPGFSIREPCLEFLAEDGEDIIFENNGNFSNELEKAAISNLKKLRDTKRYCGIRVSVKRPIPEHSGFGSKTATLLSIGRAYGLLNDEEISYTELAITARRGGTSGVGLNIIDKGGFIVEGGHSTDYKKDFTPSSATEIIVPAPLLVRYNMPQWDILLAIPRLEKTFGEKEKSFFTDVCPIPRGDVEELSRIVLIQLMPAVIEDNLEVFCQGVNRIQELAWKKNEVQLYGERIRDLMNYGRRHGALGAGMSSMGTAVYFLGGDLESVRKNLLRSSDFDERNLFFTKPNNKGVEYSVGK